MNYYQNFLTKGVCLFLVCSYILRTYTILGIRMDEAIDIILIFLYIFKFGLKGRVLPKSLNFYFIFWISTIVLSTGWTGLDALRPLLGVAHTYLLYCLFFDKCDIQLLIRYYRCVATVCICFFFLQEFTYITTGIRIPGLIPGLTVSSEFGDNANLSSMLSIDNRSSSFFSEPAHFAQFLMPLLCVELFYASDKNHFFRSAIIAVVMLLFQSGNALIGLAAIGVMFLIKTLNEKKRMSKVIASLFFLTFVISCSVYFIKSEKGAAILERTDQLSVNDYESGQSGFIRIYRGYFVYANLSPIEKIIGVNDFKTLDTRIQTSSVGFMFDENDSYFNAIQTFLIKTGFIGLIIYLILIVKMWRGNNYTGKSCLACLMALSFISSHYLTNLMAVFLIIAYKMKYEDKNKILIQN